MLRRDQSHTFIQVMIQMSNHWMPMDIISNKLWNTTPVESFLPHKNNYIGLIYLPWLYLNWKDATIDIASFNQGHHNSINNFYSFIRVSPKNLYLSYNSLSTQHLCSSKREKHLSHILCNSLSKPSISM